MGQGFTDSESRATESHLPHSHGDASSIVQPAGAGVRVFAPDGAVVLLESANSEHVKTQQDEWVLEGMTIDYVKDAQMDSEDNKRI